jgi:hypothetical protein
MADNIRILDNSNCLVELRAMQKQREFEAKTAQLKAEVASRILYCEVWSQLGLPYGTNGDIRVVNDDVYFEVKVEDQATDTGS